MNEISIFLTGVSLTLAISLIVVFYLNKNLLNLLIDICGTENRAKFWVSISNICLMLFPFMIVLAYQPNIEVPAVFEMSKIISFALYGVIGTILTISFMISLFIPRSSAHIRQRKSS